MTALGAAVMARSASLGSRLKVGVVSVHKNRFRADVGNRPTRGDEREGRGDDLVAGPTPSSSIATCNAEVPLLNPAAMFRAMNLAKSFFKLRHVGPRQKEQLSMVRAMAGVNFLAERTQLRRQVEIGNFVVHFALKNNPVA